jgi:hypothetical protein
MRPLTPRPKPTTTREESYEPSLQSAREESQLRDKAWSNVSKVPNTRADTLRSSDKRGGRKKKRMSETEQQSAKPTLKPKDVPAGTVVVATSGKPVIDSYGNSQVALQLSGDYKGRVAYVSGKSGIAQGLANGKLAMPLRLTPQTVYLADREIDGKKVKGGSFLMWGLASKPKA